MHSRIARTITFATLLVAARSWVPTAAGAQVPGGVITRPTPLQENSLASALTGAIPLVLGFPYIEQGSVTSTQGSQVKDYVWLVPGNASAYKSTSVILSFKATFTRIAVTTVTGAVGMNANFILYRNGNPTPLECRMISAGPCSFNWDVPMDVNDRWSIGVYLPKTTTCLSAPPNGCAGATPIITLMMRMGS